MSYGVDRRANSIEPRRRVNVDKIFKGAKASGPCRSKSKA